RGGGAGALTVFLLIAVLLLAGGGAAGFWAWREGYLNLDAIFAQGEPVTNGETQTAVLDPAPETVLPTPDNAETPPSPAGAVSGEPMPGEELPFTEPEPENPAPTAEDRLPAEPEAQLPAADPEDAGEIGRAHV